VFTQPREGPSSKAAIWSISTFSLGVPATFLRKRHTGNLTPHKALVVQIIAFLPSVEELVLLLFDRGVGTLGRPGSGEERWASVHSGESGLLAPAKQWRLESSICFHVAVGFLVLSSVAGCLWGNKAVGVCLLAPMELWGLLVQGCSFPRHFRVWGGSLKFGEREVEHP
jgi:hypothetical protein